MKYLVSKGLDINYSVEDKTCYYLAFENNRFEVVEYLKSILNKDSHEAIEKKVIERKKEVEGSPVIK